MVSDTAKLDVEDLLEKGLRPTFEDIIRLNALALKVERARSGFALNVLPRVSFLGSVAFREPTVGAEIWFDSASRLFAIDDPETFILLRALALCRPQEELPDPVDEKAMVAAVQDMRASLAFATIRQISAAIGYVVHGFRPESCEPAEAMKSESVVEHSPDTSYAVGLLYQGMTLRLGSAADIKTLPIHAIEEMTRRAIQEKAGMNVRKTAISIAEDDYLRTLDAITERLEKESLSNGK